jgi:hypothetical protein
LTLVDRQGIFTFEVHSVASLSVEQVDQKIREHERQIEELRSVRAAILKYAENGNSAGLERKVIQRFPRLVPNATGLKAAILGLKLPASFSVEDVIAELKAERFDFDARSPKAAVRDCLYVLAKKKKGIRLLEQGRGGRHSLYEKVST